MPRVVPSRIREFVLQAFPEVVSRLERNVPFDKVGHLEVLVRLLDELDDSLQPAGSNEYAMFRISTEAIRHHIAGWRIHGSGYGGNLKPVHGQGGKNPVAVIYDLLEICDDLAASESTAPLLFIDDSLFRSRLRRDIASAERSFRDGEFTAATVLAGGVIEALLLSEIERNREEASKAIKGLRLNRVEAKGLDSATLEELTKIADRLHLFSSDTIAAVSLTRNFRDLIHPGRQRRLQAECNRGTAHNALGALHHVIAECERLAQRRT